MSPTGGESADRQDSIGPRPIEQKLDFEDFGVRFHVLEHGQGRIVHLCLIAKEGFGNLMQRVRRGAEPCKKLKGRDAREQYRMSAAGGLSLGRGR